MDLLGLGTGHRLLWPNHPDHALPLLSAGDRRTRELRAKPTVDVRAQVLSARPEISSGLVAVEPRSAHGREYWMGTNITGTEDRSGGASQARPRHVVRDLETIDAELQLVVTFRRQARQRGGQLPLIDVVDALLDERLGAIFAIPQ
jgi:hypothetical protein